jgi:predicted Zn-dependent peptidase
MTNNHTFQIRQATRSRILRSREQATRLFTYFSSVYPRVKHVSFSGVEFISRSFADQFYKENVLFSKDKSFLTITDLNDDVKKMLEAVSRTQQPSVVAPEEVKAIKVIYIRNHEDFKLIEQFD